MEFIFGPEEGRVHQIQFCMLEGPLCTILDAEVALSRGGEGIRSLEGGIVLESLPTQYPALDYSDSSDPEPFCPLHFACSLVYLWWVRKNISQFRPIRVSGVVQDHCRRNDLHFLHGCYSMRDPDRTVKLPWFLFRWKGELSKHSNSAVTSKNYFNRPSSFSQNFFIFLDTYKSKYRQGAWWMEDNGSVKRISHRYSFRSYRWAPLRMSYDNWILLYIYLM